MKQFYMSESEFLAKQNEARCIARNLFWSSKTLKEEHLKELTYCTTYSVAMEDGAKTIGELCDRLDAIVPELADKFWTEYEQSPSKEAESCEICEIRQFNCLKCAFSQLKWAIDDLLSNMGVCEKAGASTCKNFIRKTNG